ncbi:hypothetical protein [Demequina silvatica]|uniref:hypothetical protein n=1 Tax=Demequina silvatica TaxID=1638988 RepID=UPI000783C1EF|nr:hypothetical protein [Demequina silvatica]
MTIQKDSVRSGAVSRRRIVQGMAWSAPAVLIATASPAAAASPAVTGGLVLAGVSAIQDTTTFTVRATAAYVGDGAPQADHPVSLVKVRIAVPAARLGSGTPSTSSAGWAYESTEAQVGATRTVVFAWTGDVTAAAPTAPLVASIPKTTDRTATSLTVRAAGTSNTASVQSSDTTAPVGAYSVLAWNYGPQGDVGGSGNTRYTNLQGAILANPSDNTASIVGLAAYVTVATNTLGAGTPQVAAWTSAWSYADSTVDTAAGTTTFRFPLVAGTLAPSYNATQFVFMIPRVANANKNNPVAFTLKFRGTSPTASGAVTELPGTTSV